MGYQRPAIRTLATEGAKQPPPPFIQRVQLRCWCQHADDQISHRLILIEDTQSGYPCMHAVLEAPSQIPGLVEGSTPATQEKSSSNSKPINWFQQW